MATRGFEQIVQTLIEKKIINVDDMKVLIINEDAAKLDSSHGFIVKRLQVFVNECIKQVDDVDHFDYLSQVLLALYQQVLEPLSLEAQLLILTSYPN